jgi:isoleucyl-tRNA synthetase
MTTPPEYRSTLNLPQTSFPMRADLAKREPDRVAWWAEHQVYARRLQRNTGAPWTLHDGPPYANGDLHMGHFLNRVLKDVFVKLHLLEGRRAKFVPGWDMHGLPIEMETLRHLKLDFRNIDPIELRRKCRERALHWLGVQRESILRMGVLGEYDHPYRTIDPEFEGTIVETLATLAEERQIYKGLRPTLWCPHDETALAEAEIEYREKISPSVYLRFRANQAQRRELLTCFGIADATGLPEALSILVWTTTPWTLPANVAVALRPDASYGLFRAGLTQGGVARDSELLIVAESLGPSLAVLHDAAARAGGDDVVASFEEIATANGDVIVGCSVRHPLLDRDALLVGADYVELDTGTGAVHTAPGHGVDDFHTGQRFGLPTLMPVDDQGRFTEAGGEYAHQFVFDADARIVEDLRQNGALLIAREYAHSYPHCWRCKNPVLYRATAQWFISMDANRLRRRILDQLDHVLWMPVWGAGRMAQMIENHPEWCISRQRTWGTPIPAVQCLECKVSILDPDVARLAAERFRREGADVWYTDDVSLYLPDGFACSECNGTRFEKELAIVDIWFESGVTHLAVLGKPDLHWPADLYLEGSDQFRGWFRSSLVTALATRGTPPYKRVLSTGWVVDAQGRAMHKSAGNYIGARDGMRKYGADVLRLWVASVEYTGDVRLGESVLENVAHVYRNLRNRLRFMLSALDNFRVEDIVAPAALEPFDKLALAAVSDLQRRVLESYQSYNLHEVYLALLSFDGEDLSRFYLDALKDRLYSSAATAKRRRSAQSAVFTILKTLLTLLAPILSFTAEEAWQHLPEHLREGKLSVFDLEARMPADAAGMGEELRLWALLKQMRAAVSASEGERDFDLHATVRASADCELLRALGDNLREALIVSQLDLVYDEAVEEATFELTKAQGEKCARCWKVLPSGPDPAFPGLCRPCTDIVAEMRSSFRP